MSSIGSRRRRCVDADLAINAAGRPHFSRDPNRIYIYEGAEGLVSMRFDGTDRRAHIRVTGYTYPGPGAEPNNADEIIISPDSDRVVAQVGNYVYLVTLPLIGGQTPAINVSDPSSAAFPTKRLTMIGGDFIGWTRDSRQAFWSIGRSFLKWTPPRPIRWTRSSSGPTRSAGFPERRRVQSVARFRPEEDAEPRGLALQTAGIRAAARRRHDPRPTRYSARAPSCCAAPGS